MLYTGAISEADWGGQQDEEAPLDLLLGGLAIAKPCPGHVVCSWITSPIDRQPFCPADQTYRTPNTAKKPPVEG